MEKLDFRKLLQWVLGLVAIHSICFGLALIVLPIEVIEFFGFRLQEKFFAVQGGVFHIIISTVYILAAKKPESSSRFIFVAYFTKFSATIFLFSYYFFEKHIIVVFLSGIGDFIMGLAILIAYRLYVNHCDKSLIS